MLFFTHLSMLSTAWHSCQLAIDGVGPALHCSLQPLAPAPALQCSLCVCPACSRQLSSEMKTHPPVCTCSTQPCLADPQNFEREPPGQHFKTSTWRARGSSAKKTGGRRGERSPAACVRLACCAQQRLRRHSVPNLFPYFAQLPCCALLGYLLPSLLPPHGWQPYVQPLLLLFLRS